MILVTGAAGFIGYHVASALLARGERVLGIDSLNAYYDPALKKARLTQLAGHEAFMFRKLDISSPDAVFSLADEWPDIAGIVHLAAQAGVRYSLEDPFAYVQSNVMGQVTMLEMARRLKRLRHFVYASSSSVYGANRKVPFDIADDVGKPHSLYAATKRSDELIAYTYAHLYGISCTGLRFFTVYGPWGRPDMAYYAFTRAITDGRPIRIFNRGEMWRDFTYIEDIVEGTVRALDRPAAGAPPHALYNLGNCRPQKLMDFVALLEGYLGRRAEVVFEPMQPGDVPATFADIETSRRDLGFEPVTTIEDGLMRFVAWYRQYHKMAAAKPVLENAKP
ncbi:MAG TPA: NAD-dependent epimerase/dehydratase family protein, partial [Rhizomicrobium sp.]|nr:NAD-dependent epimerase/dehydratase family protein [Rhizomicrobium sp.]